ncbi:MAG: LPS export ABC transporter periplasmic protein LptC [Gammaproteobacteria bacterium]
MSRRIILFVLLASAATAGWLMNYLVQTETVTDEALYLDPDYYMEDFTVTSMDESGSPLNRLYAVYMEHNPVDNTFELYEPEMEVFRENKLPLFITAEKGWVTNNNEVILLRGKVRLWEENESGEVILNVDTTEVRVLILEEYAETNENATIVAGKATITGRGVRAYFDESRLEILFHDQTIIDNSEDI